MKPENLVYDSKDDNANMKVIDFGTAKTFTPDGKMNETYGTVKNSLNTIFNPNFTIGILHCS